MTRRKVLAICIIGVVLAPFAAMAQPPQPDASEPYTGHLDGPLSISAREVGWFSKGRSGRWS